MKKRLLILLLLPVLLTGCTSSLQLRERAIVQAAAVDRSADGYVVTLQLFDPKSPQDDAVSDACVIRSEGESVSDAVTHAALKTGKEIFFGHNKLLIIGEKTALGGTAPIISYFSGHTRAHPNMDVLLAKGEGADLLKEPLDSSLAPVLSARMLLEDYRDNGRLVRTLLRGIAAAMEEPAAGAYLPIAVRTTEEDRPLIRMEGTALLSQGTLVGTLSPDETRGLLWLLGEVGKCRLSLTEGETDARFRVIGAKTTIVPSLQDGEPFAAVRVKVRLGIEEESAQAGKMDFSLRCAQYEKALSQQIEEEMRQVSEKLYGEIGCDAVGLFACFRRTLPEWWKENGSDWQGYLSRIGFSFSVSCRIDRAGEAVG